MEIIHPRRILILASPDTNITPLINTLVPPPERVSIGKELGQKASQPADKSDSDANNASNNASDSPIHHINTNYYSARVPIWTDRIESSETWATEWKAQAGAGEVVRAVGAWIVAFGKPNNVAEECAAKALLTHVAAVISHHSTGHFEDAESGDAVLLAVGLPSNVPSSYPFDDQAWDDHCQDCGGWEFINGEADGAKNRFGEITGFPRLVQALQAGEWDAGEENLDDMLGLEDGEDAGDGSVEGEPETDEMRRPILLEGASRGSHGGEASKAGTLEEEDDGDADLSEEDVEELQRMMVRLQAARDMGADLPPGERRKLAAKAVREVMRS